MDSNVTDVTVLEDKQMQLTVAPASDGAGPSRKRKSKKEKKGGQFWHLILDIIFIKCGLQRVNVLRTAVICGGVCKEWRQVLSNKSVMMVKLSGDDHFQKYWTAWNEQTQVHVRPYMTNYNSPWLAGYNVLKLQEYEAVYIDQADLGEWMTKVPLLKRGGKRNNIFVNKLCHFMEDIDDIDDLLKRSFSMLGAVTLDIYALSTEDMATECENDSEEWRRFRSKFVYAICNIAALVTGAMTTVCFNHFDDEHLVRFPLAIFCIICDVLRAHKQSGPFSRLVPYLHLRCEPFLTADEDKLPAEEAVSVLLNRQLEMTEKGINISLRRYKIDDFTTETVHKTCESIYAVWDHVKDMDGVALEMALSVKQKSSDLKHYEFNPFERLGLRQGNFYDSS